MGANRDPRTLVTAQNIVTGVTNAARHAKITLDPPMPAAGDLGKDLHKLAEDTRIVQKRTRFIGNAGGDPQRWRLNDSITFFQLALAPDIFVPRYRAARVKPPEVQDMIQALKTLEGTALEHLTSDWLLGHPHVRESYAGANAPSPKGQDQGDIDVLARCKQEADRRSPRDLLILGNAKRNSGEHDVDKFEQGVKGFMAQGTVSKNDPDHVIRQEIREMCDLPRTLLFVSPVFMPEDRARIQAAGHLPLDLNDMAAEMRAGWPLLQERLDQARSRYPHPPTAPAKDETAGIAARTQGSDRQKQDGTGGAEDAGRTPGGSIEGQDPDRDRSTEALMSRRK